ncbi:unnamed protein product, partial [Brassica napus]
LDLKRVGPSPNAKSRRGKTGGNNEEDTEQKKKKQTRPGGRLRDTAATAGGRWSSGGNLGEIEHVYMDIIKKIFNNGDLELGRHLSTVHRRSRRRERSHARRGGDDLDMRAESKKEATYGGDNCRRGDMTVIGAEPRRRDAELNQVEPPTKIIAQAQPQIGEADEDEEA